MLPEPAAKDGCATRTATLADLHDPLTMPPVLQQAHEALAPFVNKVLPPGTVHPENGS